MRYYQLLEPFVHGEPVGCRWIRDEEATDLPHVVSFWPDPETYVWDEAAQDIRAITESDLLPELKRAKRLELQQLGVAELDAAVDPDTGQPLFFEGSDGVLELLAACAATLAAIVPPEQLDGRIAAAAEVFAHATAKAADVDAATTVDEVEAIEW